MSQPSACHRNAATAEAGFTLIEMLVALSLLALMLTALPNALRIGFRALSAAENLERDAARQTAMDFIEQRLQQAAPIYEHRADGRTRIVFRGEARSVAFVASAASGATSGLYQFELKAVVDATGRSGVAASYAPYLPGSGRPDGQARGLEQRQERLLLEETGLWFRYFGSLTPRGTPEWSDAWDVSDNIPELVEVRLLATRNDASRVLLVPLRLRLRL